MERTQGKAWLPEALETIYAKIIGYTYMYIEFPGMLKMIVTRELTSDTITNKST